MNKVVGATSLGAAILAGIIFQTRMSVPANTGRNNTEAAAPAKTVANDGPWLASCNYWAAAQSSNASVLETSAPSDATTAGLNGEQLQLNALAGNSACGPDDWNVPFGGSLPAEVSAIIATVPDPIHSHLALDFDRSIDAILLAAADNHYLSSYFWLPWRSQIGPGGETASTAVSPTRADRTRERQPGLIILRYAPNASEWQQRETNGFASTDYRRVIYLFLVAETPALGINGVQLQNAFHYEKVFKDQGATLSVRPWLSTRTKEQRRAVEDAAQKQSVDRANSQPQKQPCADPADQLSIIGPFYSGSAASLHAGVEAALADLHESCVSISGITSTAVAVHELDPDAKQIYRSFGENTSFEQERFLQSLAATGYDLSRVAVLAEAGTVFGSNAGPVTAGNVAREESSPRRARPFRKSDVNLAEKGTVLYIRFPRELSLLRNAEANQSSGIQSGAPPTPYLNLSLKDYSADDTVPRFSTNQSPLSLEAQLMAIAHQIQSARSQFIVMSASNVLDVIFLAQFLHRACPDARLVILSDGDLLFERDGENAPYIGSISISPYLLSSLDFGNRVQWLHADYQAEAIYNAASFTFWNGSSSGPPILAGYRNYPIPKEDEPTPHVQFQQIPLWATAIGSDGYYPLAVLNWCGSDTGEILPTIKRNALNLPRPKKCVEDETTDPPVSGDKQQHVWDYVPESINENSGISPTLLWGVLVGFISLACIAHCILLLGADFWSPFTRDLAIDQNDLPHRRAIHVNIGTSVLVAIAFVTGYPLIRVGHYFHLATGSYALVVILLLAASLALVCTIKKTWRYRRIAKQPLYGFFNFVAAAALIGTSTFWALICGSDNLGGHHSYAGLYFSYRCLRPLSGVCPLLPILLLLFAWYLWSIYQTARLRFSQIHRPRIARRRDNPIPYSPQSNAYDLFVPDNTLESCAGFSDNCLYHNITCLLITKEVVLRLCAKLKSERGKRIPALAKWIDSYINRVLGIIYFVLFVLCVFAGHIHSLDHFLFWPIAFSSAPTLYEFLVAALFFPLIMVALSGWLRVILIWGSISRGLLEPLERMPIRFAFSRFNGGGWMSMLRQKGLHIRWRDMARSTESIRQIIHHPALKQHPELYKKLSAQYEVINARIYELMEKMNAAGTPLPPGMPVPATPAAAEEGSIAAAIERASQTEEPCPSDCLWDLPAASGELCDIYHIEQGYARFCTILIEDYLAPYWDKERTGFVDDESVQGEKEKPGTPQPGEPSLTQSMEELIVLRYVALIRAVLINIRYLMLFVSTAFVLALIAWNSYPFQPHAFLDWCFTILLAILTLGFVWVFAQMHRNAILSRITNTNANELGWEFYLRLITFGAVPVLTWLAYQFPDIGGSLYRIIQPGLQVMK